MKNFIMLFLMTVIFSCDTRRDSSYLEGPWPYHAYGKKWEQTRMVGTRYRRNLTSGHGILVEHGYDWHQDFLKVEGGEPILIQERIYAVQRDNIIKQTPPYTINGWNLHDHEDKLFIVANAITSEMTDCNLYPKDSTEYLTTQDKVFDFIGEFDPIQKRFVIDRFITRVKREEMDAKRISTKPLRYDYDFIEELNASEKYLCE